MRISRAENIQHFGRNNKLALSRYSWTKSREDCYYGVDAAFKPFIIKKHIVPERDYPLSKATIEPLLVEEEDYASFVSNKILMFRLSYITRKNPVMTRFIIFLKIKFRTE